MIFAPGRPVFIIAEVGSNWRDQGDIMTSIQQAKACGADAVKFQAFNHHALYGVAGKKESILPIEWLPQMREKTKAAGIELMVSAFDEQLMAEIDKYVNIHKIASSNACHIKQLSLAAALDKPVLWSIGGTSLPDIKRALKYLKKDKTVVMYCHGSYPSFESDVRMIGELKKALNTELVGLSDHSLDVYNAPITAYRYYGAVAIEKHVNFISGIVGDDSPHSLDTAQFSAMVKALRGQTNPLAGNLGSEKDFVSRHNVRCIARTDIPIGAKLIYGENYGFHRSLVDDAEAFGPIDYMRTIEGKPATDEIKAGDGIGPNKV